MINLKITATQASIIAHALQAQISTYEDLLSRHESASIEAKQMLNNAIKARKDLIELMKFS